MAASSPARPDLATRLRKALARALRVAGKVDPIFVDEVAELVPALGEQVRDGDVVIAMGAGSICTVAQKLKDSLEETR